MSVSPMDGRTVGVNKQEEEEQTKQKKNKKNKTIDNDGSSGTIW